MADEIDQAGVYLMPASGSSAAATQWKEGWAEIRRCEACLSASLTRNPTEACGAAVHRVAEARKLGKGKKLVERPCLFIAILVDCFCALDDQTHRLLATAHACPSARLCWRLGGHDGARPAPK